MKKFLFTLLGLVFIAIIAIFHFYIQRYENKFLKETIQESKTDVKENVEKENVTIFEEEEENLIIPSHEPLVN